VLVVDDNATHRRILEELLSTWGMLPESAGGVGHALALMRSRAARNNPFQIILTDRHMPGADGFGLVEQMRAGQLGTGSNVILMVTSAGQQTHLDRCRELGMAACLTKPLRRAELRSALAAALTNAGIAPLTSSLVNAAIAVSRSASLSLNILLAEDNPINERVACGILAAAGHSVQVARVGSHVQPLLAAHEFDLILMDIQMPEMDGFEVTAAIRETEKQTGAHIPIIAMTAHAMDGYKERCLAGGMDGYLTKPIRRDLLLAALEFCQTLNARRLAVR
jgi:CheY-like chemotaxis protein